MSANLKNYIQFNLMVKGFDPTTTDPSKIVLEYLIRWTKSESPLSMHEAQRFVKYWLKSSSYTSDLYHKFKQQNMEVLPNIKLKKKCHQNLLFSFFYKQPIYDEKFPAYHTFEDVKQNQPKGQIVLCLNYITNKTQLKQNLDRQLTVLYEQAKYSKSQNKVQKNIAKNQTTNTKQDSVSSNTFQEEKDIHLMKSLIKGCKVGYKNYMLDDKMQQRLALKCAKYLFFRRTQRKLPQDSLFRYTTKISEEAI